MTWPGLYSQLLLWPEKKQWARRGEKNAKNRKETHKNLLRFILPHAKNAASSALEHLRRQPTNRHLTALDCSSCCWRCIFTAHMPVYLWFCSWQPEAFKHLKVGNAQCCCVATSCHLLWHMSLLQLRAASSLRLTYIMKIRGSDKPSTDWVDTITSLSFAKGPVETCH